MEYADQSQISKQPAFSWWFPHVIKKRERIISKTKSKYWTRTHKFGIKVPNTIKEAKYFDTKNGNTLWWYAILKEMSNVRLAFEIFDREASDIPPGYQ